VSKLEIEMQGDCLYCGKRTDWFPCEGWVFHKIATHWRCQVCHCATQPQLFLPASIMRKLEAEQAVRHIADDLVIEIEV
jgi:hypothetical protein